MKYISAKKAAQILDYTPTHLRRLADAGKIDYIRTEGGQRRYNVDSFIKGTKSKSHPTTICYCRIAHEQLKDELNQQFKIMKGKYPTAEFIYDIGSGLDFNRAGLQDILERLLDGQTIRLVITHRDRLAHFGVEVIQYMVEQNGGELQVLDEDTHGTQAELAADLLAILHTFSNHRLATNS
ncbi:IS607 family transposase [Candidatus Poribacteria bacterium]|nr:MAG: IS607 family transposase [Candidatus Poribacteria bacterium]